MADVRKYLAEIGRRGGVLSRRALDSDTARHMVRVREARRAFRRFHAECFASEAADRPIMGDDIPWVAERLIRHGGDTARGVGLRLAGAVPALEAPPLPRDTAVEAESLRRDAIRRQRPADRLRQALRLSESMRAAALARLRGRHPERTDLELVELLLGTDLPGRGGRR